MSEESKPPTLGEILKSIQDTKVNLYKDSDETPGYESFVVNRCLSYHIDCCIPAYEMSLRAGGLDPQMQYEFLLHTIRKAKRPFAKFAKKDRPEDLKLIQEHYNYSIRRAMEALEILSEADVEEIRQSKIETGGIKRGKK